MKRFQENFYLALLDSYANTALYANECINVPRESVEQIEAYVEQIYMHISTILTSTAGISRLFWPSKRSGSVANGRAAHLRNCLSINDGHALKNRDFRNHFEHFEQRLDNWIATTTNPTFAFNNLGAVRDYGGNIKDHFKLYDPQSKQLVFLGESINMSALVDGVHDVKKRVIRRRSESVADGDTPPGAPYLLRSADEN